MHPPDPQEDAMQSELGHQMYQPILVRVLVPA